MTSTRRATLLGAALFLLIATPFALRSCDTPNDQRLRGLGASAVTEDRGDGKFTVAGGVTQPMSPGIDVPIVLRIVNPYDFDLAVTRLVVSVASVEAPAADLSHTCTIDDFVVVQLPPQAAVSIAPHDSTMVDSTNGPGASRPTISLLNRAVNQDGCKGAEVALRYSAEGRGD